MGRASDLGFAPWPGVQVLLRLRWQRGRWGCGSLLAASMERIPGRLTLGRSTRALDVNRGVQEDQVIGRVPSPRTRHEKRQWTQVLILFST